VIFNFRKTSEVSAAPSAAVPAEPEAPAKAGWLARLKSGLKKSGVGLTEVLVGTRVDEALFEQLEEALILADAGVEATGELMADLRSRSRFEGISDPAELKVVLGQALLVRLKPLQKTFDAKNARPLVVMMAGVNGAGKTTSIGKLAKHFQGMGKTVLLAAGDTFRAAAREQLMVWGERNGVAVIAQEGGDPGAVVFDAIGAGKARGVDVVLADTAGRLPTQRHLMDELAKIKRVMKKAMDDAPHEVLLVVDGTTGQNALAQVRAFDEAVGLTGLIVTKLDGSAKGGMLLAIAKEHPVPIYFVGVGESIDDLQPFVAKEFVDALLELTS
jgi:fused signal recognition particle receptor